MQPKNTKFFINAFSFLLLCFTSQAQSSYLSNRFEHYKLNNNVVINLSSSDCISCQAHAHHVLKEMSNLINVAFLTNDDIGYYRLAKYIDSSKYRIIVDDSLSNALLIGNRSTISIIGRNRFVTKSLYDNFNKDTLYKYWSNNSEIIQVDSFYLKPNLLSNYMNSFLEQDQTIYSKPSQVSYKFRDSGLYNLSEAEIDTFLINRLFMRDEGKSDDLMSIGDLTRTLNSYGLSVKNVFSIAKDKYSVCYFQLYSGVRKFKSAGETEVNLKANLYIGTGINVDSVINLNSYTRFYKVDSFLYSGKWYFPRTLQAKVMTIGDYVYIPVAEKISNDSMSERVSFAKLRIKDPARLELDKIISYSKGQYSEEFSLEPIQKIVQLPSIALWHISNARGPSSFSSSFPT